MDGFALSPTGEEIPVKMWECDTVTQAKEKILDAIYKVRISCTYTHIHAHTHVHTHMYTHTINTQHTYNSVFLYT